MAANTTLNKGNLVRWSGGATGNVGTVVEADSDARRVRVAFDGGEEHTFAWPFSALQRLVFPQGSPVRILADDQLGVIIAVHAIDGLAVYEVSLPGEVVKTVVESGLRPGIVTDPVALLRAGSLHTARSVNLRLTATRLRLAHQFEELSSLSNSRVEIKPHQVGVLHRVTTSYPHRFLLADEVGLGKTIEAGLIIKELKARGMADRVLVLAPSGIATQWQVEMKTKFSMVFSMYRGDSVRFLQQNNPGENVWTLHDNVVASTTYASWDDRRAREIASAGWDLIVIDEAHHARRTWQGEAKYTETRLYKLARMLTDPDVGHATSVLFLTATPMQLHRFELYSLVELLDPALFTSFRDFDAHAESLAGLNRAVDGVRQWTTLPREERDVVLADATPWTGSAELVSEEALSSADGRQRATEALERQHRLSEVMIRNRKAVVGGFMPRVAVVWPVEMTDAERSAYDAATEYARSGFERARAMRANALGFVMVMFQKLNSSSSYALRQSLERRIERLERQLTDALPARTQGIEEVEEELEERPTADALGDLLAIRARDRIDEEVMELRDLVRQLDAIPVDTKAKVLKERLAEVLAREPNARVLVFTQFRDTQVYLRERIGPPWTVGVFHGQLKPDEKDEAVRQFREGPGPQVLLSTEAGGEGRNFQFCHILVNYDLPWNPMKIEQRIGRLDRIGQRHPVTVVNFAIADTVEERVLEVLARRIRVFEETIGGLDPILGEVEQDLRQVFLSADAERERALRRLEQTLEDRIARARDTETRLADLIMDTRSFRQDEVRALLERSSSLDHDVMRRFVINALTELGAKVDADPTLPGVYQLRFRGQFLNEFPQFAREGVTRRVTFSPSVAMDFETVEFLAFGHELVDALVARVMARSYPGRASHRMVRTAERDAASGWLFTFVLEVDGVMRSKQVLPVFVDRSGRVDEDMAGWLMERAARGKREDFAAPALPSGAVGLDEAVEVARAVALRRLIERQAELSVANRERLAAERAKLERYYDYRQQAAQDKVAAVQSTFERLSASDDPEVARIVPVWATNLERARRAAERLTEERETRLGALARGEDVSAQHELLTASWVDIVPED